MLICSCSAAGLIENMSEESAPEVSSQTTSAKAEDDGDKSSEAKEIPEGYRSVDFGEFSVLICDDSFSNCAPMEIVTAENNKFIGNDGENKRVIAELISVEDVTDHSAPFAVCDEKYSSAANVAELTFNGFEAKKYHVQTKADETSSVLSNNIFYCIYLDEKIITFAYYPVMGYGGMRTENIETVLDTIKLNK